MPRRAQGPRLHRRIKCCRFSTFFGVKVGITSASLLETGRFEVPNMTTDRTEPLVAPEDLIFTAVGFLHCAADT